ncbi:Lrp/AsnC family transcriptional regulator [Candidatus Woesearchaeota archaeon]|nr:Lrp/AsnC family transcriptional regulator [Candidatus Woesearchaeota archaeon]
MEQNKLSLKDRRILEALDMEPNISLSALAKKIRVSRQVADYRLSRLLSRRTIYAFYALIDAGRLGYSCFRIHLRVKNVSSEKYARFAEELFHAYPTFWVAFVSGSFDLMIDIFAKTSNEFERILLDIVQNNKEIIQSYETLVLLELNLYSYGYFMEPHPERRIMTLFRNTSPELLDPLDIKLLAAIKNNSRLPYQDVGRKIHLTRNAVKDRIRKLEGKGIIKEYMVVVNFNHFHKQSFKVFVRYNNSKIEQERALLEEIRRTPGILNTLKLLGKWNLDIELHMDSIRELQRFIIELRNRYDLIEDYEIIQIIDDYGIDFFPSKLAQALGANTT